MRAVRPGERNGKPGDRRAQVLSVALELFAEQGYAATTIGQIAERTSVTPPALYYHFESKQDLVTELVGPHLDALENVVAGGGGQPSRPALLARYAEVVASAPAIARFLDRDAAGLTQVGVTQRHEAVGDRVQRALAGPDPAQGVAPAAAALGAVRRLVVDQRLSVSAKEATEVALRLFD